MPKKATVHDKLSYIQMNQWSKFLKKLWCCVGGRVQQGNLVLLTELLT